MNASSKSRKDISSIQEPLRSGLRARPGVSELPPDNARLLSPNGYRAPTVSAAAPARSVWDLLDSHDAIFVARAYRTLLGREPDTEGRADYLAKIRSGTSKLSILDALARSREARIFACDLPGLKQAIFGYRMACLPLLGPIFARILNSEGESSAQRRLRRIENQVFALHQQLARGFDDLRDVLIDHKRGGAARPEEFAQRAVRQGDREPLLDARFTPRARNIYRVLKGTAVGPQR